MPRLIAILLVCILAASCAVRHPAGTGTKRPRITGIFSSMHFIEEAEDVGGIEVFITYTTDGMEGHYNVHFQMAEGAPGEPALVRASVDGNDVQFTVPEVGTFKGTVHADALVGKMIYVSGNQESIRLPRKKSYWQ